jgi:hypothetical protein
MKIGLVLLSMLPAIISSSFAGERIIVPDGVYYHRFAAKTSGIEAIWINPAFLGYDQTIMGAYLGEYNDGAFLNNWGAVVCGDGIGISFRHLQNASGCKYDEYIFAFGAKLGSGFFWGGSYKQIKNGPPGIDKRHFWNIGLALVNAAKLQLGAMFSNLNRGRVNGARSDFEQLYSVAYKAAADKLTILSEISLSSGQSLSHALLNYGVEYNIGRRLALYGCIDSDDNYQIGVRFDFGRYFAGNQRRHYSDGRLAGATSFAGYNTGISQSLRK